MNITIIGLGRIGASVGLALGARSGKIQRMGHDILPDTSRRAKQLGAVDKISYNLPDSIRKADIVVLALPLDKIEDTLNHIAHDLKAGALVLETAPAKVRVSEWMHAHLPPRCAYIGLSPIIQARYQLLEERGPDAARADLFEGCLIGVTSPPSTSGWAIDAALDLIGGLGASPLFIGQQEADGVMAALHLLPQLAAAGLVSAIAQQPGWQENRKLAGGAFARAAAVLAGGDTPAALAKASASDPAASLRLLDALVGEIQSLRDRLADGDRDGLAEQILYSVRSVNEWAERRKAGDWTDQADPSDETPTSWRDRLRGWIRPGGGAKTAKTT